jgi:tripartite-type tricarboxylate transporter receptor subunit TctC
MAMTIRSVAAAAAASLLSWAVGSAVAQDYPNRPLRIIVPFAAGGGADALARLLGQRFNESLRQPAVVENRAGAGGNIGAELVVKSPPDGYTLMLSTASIAVNRTLYPKLTFDLRKDLVAITQMASSVIVLTTHPSVPARNVKELVALARNTKGGLNFGSNGTGTTSHLSGVLLNQMARMPFNHIPYKGVAPAIIALLSGEVEIAFPAVLAAAQHIRSGRMRGLAVTTKQKSTALPELPTLDSMYPGFDIYNWFVLFAPAGTSQAIVKRLNAEVVKALQHPDVKTFMVREGADAVGNSPAEAAAFINGEVEKFAGIIRSTGVTLE